MKVAPPGSLMVALAGLGFTYLGIGQIISCFDVGHLGLLPLGVALVGFFGEVKTSPFPAAGSFQNLFTFDQVSCFFFKGSVGRRPEGMRLVDRARGS